MKPIVIINSAYHCHFYSKHKDQQQPTIESNSDDKSEQFVFTIVEAHFM